MNSNLQFGTKVATVTKYPIDINKVSIVLKTNRVHTKRTRAY